MKKLLSIIMVALMATSAFAFVPLSNEQNNIGSYQRGATRGMFYNELDIVSAAPVELLDFSGNTLYTNWGNVRNWNDIANYGSALDWGQTTNNTDISYFTFGVTGNPLSYAGIEDSRSGIIYQNYGAKSVSYNLDTDAGTGSGGGLDSEGEWAANTYTLEYATTTPTVGKIVNRTASGLKYNDNTTYTQWNIGTSYKLMDKVSLGLSLERETDTNIMTTEGSFSYTDRYLTDTGAINAGGIRGQREINTYSVSLPTQEYDKASSAETIILPQARINISDSFNVDVGVGVDFVKNLGIDTTSAGANEKTVVTVTARESVLISTGAAGASATDGRIQYFNTGTAIVGKTAVAAVQMDYDDTLAVLPALNGNVFKADAPDTGISNFADDREGTAPVIRIEAKKKFEKVDITGICNFSSLSRDVDASLTEREYVQNSAVIVTTGVANNWSIAPLTSDSFIEKDYTKTSTYKGTAKNGNLDLGAKIAMKALEGVKVSFGGFIRRVTSKTELDTTDSISELCSYDDVGTSTDAFTNGGVSLGGGTVSSGTITTALKPGAIAASADGQSRTAYGMNTGNGEGSWLQTKSSAGTYSEEIVTVSYNIPVGIEIPLSKKWTFRAGTEYVMTKEETTEETTTNLTYTQTTATPAGEAAQPTSTVINNQPASKKSVYRTESHDVYYTYGVQFDATPSLTIACNAFLDTNSAAATDASGTSNANFFDLATYRTLSLSAAIKF